MPTKRKPDAARVCAGLSVHAVRCRRTDTLPVSYHGDPEIYGCGLDGGPGVGWVRIYLCPKHRRKGAKKR